MKRLLAALCLCSIAVVARAEISQKFGALEVHYNALTTDELQPDVARATGARARLTAARRSGSK